MKPEEFTSFKVDIPDKNKWIIVTNNLKAFNAFGEMSHVWLTNFWTTSNTFIDSGIVIFDDCDNKILNLTHWKYA